MSEEKQAKGKIEAISKNEKNFTFKIGDLWFSGWNNKFKEQLNTIEKGDIAELSYIQNESGGRIFNNVVEGKFKLTKGEKGEFKPAGDNAYAKRDEEKRGDILKSVSLKAGVETMNHMTLNAGEDGKEVAKKVIEIANEYYTWLKGEK